MRFALTDITNTNTNPETDNVADGRGDDVDIVELEFDLDDEVRAEIELCRSRHSARLENFSGKLLTFPDFGKNRIKAMKIHPDTFVQVALQGSMQ